jgi:hypothetical protein
VTHQDPGKCCPLACRLYIQATGKLDQNVFVERFNQTYRDKVLGACVLESIDQVARSPRIAYSKYSEERAHDCLCRMMLLTFMPSA